MEFRPVGLIPAAGHATRLQPLEGSKEMIEIGGRRVIDHLVERMHAADCERIRLVTRPEKKDLIAHAEAVGLEVVLGRPPTVGASLEAGLAELGPDTAVLFGLPDTIWEPMNGFSVLLSHLQDFDVALGLFWNSEPARSDVVTMGSGLTVSAVEVKPRAPDSNWIWGCAAARCGAFDRVVAAGEPGLLFHELAQQGRVAGIELSRSFIDIGTPVALASYIAGLERPSKE